MSDTSLTAIHAALSGLSLRQRAIADNIANINTPGYLSTNTDFESSLKSALNGDSSQVFSTVSKSLAPTRQDGNNVDLDQQTLDSVDTGLKYQTMIEALNAKYRILRTSIG